jgi:hypothetical protein
VIDCPTALRRLKGTGFSLTLARDWLKTTDGWYYSRIESRPAWQATVFSAPADAEITDENPGTVLLRLEPRWRNTRVFDAASRELGIVRSEGVIRGLRFVMRRAGVVVWSSTGRSTVRKRHRLQVAGGDIWTFDTPFFWWHHYFTGAVTDQTRLVGRVGPTKRHWGFAVEPGRANADLLAAVAFLHWKWLRW